MLALTLCVVKLPNYMQLRNSSKDERVKPEKSVVFLLKALEIDSILHILPTLCCFVTAAETPTPPLFCLLSLKASARAGVHVCVFLCVHLSVCV